MSTIYRIVHRYNMIVQTYCLNCSWLLCFKQYQFSQYAWLSNILALGVPNEGKDVPETTLS